jgi:methionine-rich copper-binding protein CopC
VNSLRTGLTGTLSILGAAALVLAPAAAASAHDVLESSAPAQGESVTADPGTVSLGFSDSLMTIGGSTDGFAVQVTDPEGMHYESGCLTVEGTGVTAPVALGGAGGYVVTWQVVSSDGHPTSGQYEFDYSPASLDGAHTGLAEAPACGSAWSGEPDGVGVTTPVETPVAEPTATAAPTPAATDPADEGAAATDAATDSETDAAGVVGPLPWWAVVLIIIAGLGVLGAVIVLVLRRMRGGDDDTRDGRR